MKLPGINDESEMIFVNLYLWWFNMFGAEIRSFLGQPGPNRPQGNSQES